MAGMFEIYEDKAGEYRFRLKAGNGETVLVSEGYASKASAINGIDSVGRNASNPGQFESVETTSGKFLFKLKARNHQIIGTSQTYGSASGRDNGIQAVGRAATGAEIADLTLQA